MLGIIKPPVGAQLNLDHPLARGLVGCWLMNEGSGGNVHDYSGQWNEGTISGMNDPPIATSGWNAGPHGGALAFDGTNSRISCINDNPIGIAENGFTLSAWFIQKGGISDQIIYGNYLQLRDTIFYTQTTDSTWQPLPFSQPSLNQHHYIVATFNGSLMQIYVDGYFIDDKSVDADIRNLAQLDIGWREIAAERFNGLISSVSIYNRALSAEEIAYIYAFPYCMFDEPYPVWMNDFRPTTAYYHNLLAGAD